MKKLTLALLMIFTIVVNVSVAQNFENGEIETELDNRGLAMGRTAITSATGSSSIFSNPSIIATFDKMQTQAGGKLLLGTISDEDVEENLDNFDAKYSPFPSNGHLSFAMPYQLANSDLKLAFGIGYHRNEGYKLTTDFRPDRGTVEGNVRSGGALSTLTPAVAVNIQEKYFIGASLNRVVGKINITTEIISDIRDRREEKTEVEIDQAASFLRLGALAELTPELTVGLMYRPKFEWDWKDITSKEYEDGKLENTDKERGGEITIPSVLGLGVEYKVAPQLIVSGELQTRPFSDFEVDEKFADELGLARDNLAFDDGYCYRFGGEYIGFDYPIRFGVFRDAILRRDEDNDSPRALTGITGGFGFNAGKTTSLDVSALYATWNQEDEEGRKYSEKLLRIGVSATFVFE
jgi:long-subunit fatty acid transport protein